MFHIETMAKAKLTDVEVLSQKNREPDDNPGAKLTLEMEMASSMLALFDGSLRSFLLTKAPGAQGEIDGVEGEQLSTIGAKIGAFAWDLEISGYTLTIDNGLGGKSNLEVVDCSASGFRITPKPNGFVVKFHVESEDISEAMFGKLAKLKSRDMLITLDPPEVAQQPLKGLPDGKTSKAKLDASGRSPFPKGGAKTDAEVKGATEAFVEQHGKAAH